MSVDIHDVITCATFCDDRLRGLGVAMGRISHFPIDLRRRPYNTLALPPWHRQMFAVINLLARRARYYFTISVCLSVCPSRCGIVSKRIHVINFFANLIVLSPAAITKAWALAAQVCEKTLRISTEIAVYLGSGIRDPIVTKS